jgi:hypothetical protein
MVLSSAEDKARRMDIFHHFGFKISGENDRQEFRDAGIKLPTGVRIPGGGQNRS